MCENSFCFWRLLWQHIKDQHVNVLVDEYSEQFDIKDGCPKIDKNILNHLVSLH